MVTGLTALWRFWKIVNNCDVMGNNCKSRKIGLLSRKMLEGGGGGGMASACTLSGSEYRYVHVECHCIPHQI